MLHKPLLRLITRNVVRNTQRGGHHSAVYRAAPPPSSRASRIGGQLLSTLMWWWILWHIWEEPGHIVGEFPYPDPMKWTNKELGIPQDKH